MRQLFLVVLFSSVAASAFAQAHDLPSPAAKTVSAKHPGQVSASTPPKTAVQIEADRITSFQRAQRHNNLASAGTNQSQPPLTQPSAQAPLAPNGLQPMTLYTTQASGAVHTVIKKDTLYNISKRYGVTVEAIKHVNQLQGSHIQLGQNLVIPAQQHAALDSPSNLVTITEPVTVTPNGDTQVAIDPGQGRLTAYAVASGDTLAAISRRTCVPEARLISDNALTNPDTLSPGHMLALPADHCLAK